MNTLSKRETSVRASRGLLPSRRLRPHYVCLKGLRGRFILTLNDCPEVRDLYAWARMKPAKVTYTAAGGGSAISGKELIVTRRGRR